MDDIITHDQTLAEMKRMPWTEGLCEEALEEFAAVAERVQYEENEFVHRAEDRLDGVYFVTRGRIRAEIFDIFGREVLRRPLTRGAVIGLFSIAQPDQANANFRVLEPSTLLKLEFEQLHELIAKYPALQINLYRTAGQMMRQIVMVDRTKDQPSVVALIHQSPASRKLTRELVSRLAPIEKRPCVASDDPNWQPMEDVPFRSLIEDGKMFSAEQGRQQLKEWSKFGRIFVDAGAERDVAELARVMMFADTVLWCVRPSETDSAFAKIKALCDRSAGWREKMRLVWLLDENTPVAPVAGQLSDLVDRDFKISFSSPAENCGLALQRGVERIVHHLRGVQIGIALGGGAARGMAHLGVLQALEQHGIYVDMIAGTSAGAMTGTVYASGLDVGFSVQRFCEDLRLPWFYRRIPGGGYWYLLMKYRRGKFDSMLRPYLRDYRLQQLPLPMYTVTVDLVRGKPVIRETGDAVSAILESINLPGLARPILGENEALVDGGLVNNIPADVLVAKGCNFVIASSVTAKLEEAFAGIGGSTNGGKRRKPSSLQTMMRGHIVQSVNMNAVGVQPADFVIEPDVTAFDLSEFERTDELAAVGERTAHEAVAKIKQLLSKLDGKLFPAA